MIYTDINVLFHSLQVDAKQVDETERKLCMEKVEKIIADCDLMRTAQDILGHYLTLERFLSNLLYNI